MKQGIMFLSLIADILDLMFILQDGLVYTFMLIAEHCDLLLQFFESGINKLEISLKLALLDGKT
jgi:hypothetical protein